MRWLAVDSVCEEMLVHVHYTYNVLSSKKVQPVEMQMAHKYRTENFRINGQPTFCWYSMSTTISPMILFTCEKKNTTCTHLSPLALPKGMKIPISQPISMQQVTQIKKKRTSHFYFHYAIAKQLS